MKKLIEVNVEEYKTSLDRITINIKNIEIDEYNTIIKCFKNLEDVINLEAKRINLIKLQKSVFLNLPNLQILDLRDNCLEKFSKNFINLKYLRILKLDDNCLTYFPSFLTKLDNIEYLSLCQNKITFIPSSIQYMQKLKTFKLSNNKISSLPIEFGLLKSLESLFIDANHFIEIPTTLCYLKHLSELSFEWLEFVEPQFNKLIKDNIGKTIISLIRNSLQEMIKQNILYCDFITFVDKNSNPNNEEKKTDNKDKDKSQDNLNKKLMKIFHAIDNDYYGVIQSLINSNQEFLKIKNNDNKTPLYMSIHSNKLDITKLIIKKIDLKNIPNPHTYLHKAIRMRDPYLTKQFIDLGIDINASDDQGATCMHVLFSAFTKCFSKCILIGDMLLQYNIKLNVLNNDNWAPVHIAARRSSKECLIWIVNLNKIFKESDREQFDLNIKGKNKWTPLHLSVNGFRFEETLILLDNGCDLFAKNSDYKIPRKVSNGNYLLTKLLRNYENNYLQKKYSINNINEYNHCFTTVEDVSNIDDFSSFIKSNKLYKDERGTKEIFSNISEDLSKSLANNFDFKLKKNEEENLKKSTNTINVIRPIDNPMNKSLGKLNETPKFFKNMSIKSSSHITIANSKFNNKLSNNTNVMANSSSINNSKINLHFHKEVILNYDNSLAEKYESILNLKMASSTCSTDLENVLRSILESLDIDFQPNSIIFLDLINIILMNQYFSLVPYLEEVRDKLVLRKGKFYNLMEEEITNSIEIMKSIHESFKKTVIICNKPQSNIPIKPKKGKNFKKKITPDNNKFNKRLYSKESLSDKKSINNLPRMKIINKYFEKDKSRQLDDFHSEDMNEKSQSNIDMRNFNQISKSGFNRDDDSISYVLESCNVLDSSYSVIKQDDHKYNSNTIISKLEVDRPQIDYAIIPPKKLESSYFEFEN